MNRIFVAMVVLAFMIAAALDLSDPPVRLTSNDRTTLVEQLDETDDGGEDVDAMRLAEVAVAAIHQIARDQERGDVVRNIERSGGLNKPLRAALGQSLLDDPVEGEDIGEAVVVRLEQLGDFQFDETWGRKMQEFNNELFKMIKAAVMSVVLPLIGAMAFFLGLMKVAEAGGLMTIIAKLVRPLMVVLFPDVPPNHPAMSAMILNMAANAMGLGNAATPFGIKAMQELDTINPHKGTATNAMCLFLAINTSAVSLLPTGVIAIRGSMGSLDPAGILGTTLMATVMSTTAAIVATKLYQRFSPIPEPDPDYVAGGSEDAVDDSAYPLWVSLLALVGLFVFAGCALVWGREIAPWIVPVMIVSFIGFGAARGVAVYETFVEGAKEGWEVAVRIIPFLVAILGAVGMLRGSGAIDGFVYLVGWMTEPLGMPAEALPMALLRPLSGLGRLWRHDGHARGARSRHLHRLSREHDAGLHRDDVLRARGVLRRGAGQAHPPLDGGSPHGRSRGPSLEPSSR